jgi:hypothetical protein
MCELALEQLLDRIEYAQGHAAHYDRMAAETLDPATRAHLRELAQEWRRYADRLWRIYLRARGLSRPGTIMQ